MAFFRALESLRPEGQRLFVDPYAQAFLSPRFRRALRLAAVPMLGPVVPWIADWRVPGARASGIARTRLIDEAVSAALQDGAEQVVILGAGFDCRGLRIPEMRRVPCFEVDHPNTLAAKRQRLHLVNGSAPANLRFADIDFNRESLEEALPRTGFDATRRTVFLWEGVTNYLTPQAVDAVLRFVGSCADGTRLIFTYVHAAALDGSGRFPDAKKLLRDLDELGEPWTFGLDPAEIPGCLRQRGLSLVSDTGSQEYRAKYMGPRGRHMKGYDFYRVAVADADRPESRDQ